MDWHCWPLIGPSHQMFLSWHGLHAHGSNMQLKGVDDWLTHWLKLQKKGKLPLTFTDPSKPQPKRSQPRKWSMRKGKAHADVVNSDSEGSDDDLDDAAPDNVQDGSDNSGMDDQETQPKPSGSSGISDDTSTLPPHPWSAIKSKSTRRAFLESLSDDKHYRSLIKLLLIAKVCANCTLHSRL